MKLSDLFVSDCKQAPTANGTISLFGGLCMEMVDKVFPSLWQCASVEHNAHILITLKDPPPHFCLPTFAYFPRFLPFFLPTLPIFFWPILCPFLPFLCPPLAHFWPQHFLSPLEALSTFFWPLWTTVGPPLATFGFSTHFLPTFSHFWVRGLL